MLNVGIVRFLGTNCDRDVWQAVESMGHQPHWLWHESEFEIDHYQALILPGGFSFGDYLRSGAMAAKAPVMKSVKKAAGSGVPVLGICNGFQILCEAQLLPGALLKNESELFHDKWVDLELHHPALENPFTKFYGATRSLSLPIAHGDGRYFIDEASLVELKENNQIVATYLGENPNGSVDGIAGVRNQAGNVVGLMPHPERAIASWMGSEQGSLFFKLHN